MTVNVPPQPLSATLHSTNCSGMTATTKRGGKALGAWIGEHSAKVDNLHPGTCNFPAGNNSSGQGIISSSWTDVDGFHHTLTTEGYSQAEHDQMLAEAKMEWPEQS